MKGIRHANRPCKTVGRNLRGFLDFPITDAVCKPYR